MAMGWFVLDMMRETWQETTVESETRCTKLPYYDLTPESSEERTMLFSTKIVRVIDCHHHHHKSCLQETRFFPLLPRKGVQSQTLQWISDII